jgi:hypothetical protein
VDYLGLAVEYKLQIMVGTFNVAGWVGPWGQPAGDATGTATLLGTTANSTVTITSRPGGNDCNTVDGGDWGHEGPQRHDSGTIILYLRNSCPGDFDVFIDASMKLTATGPYLAAPAASITDGNGHLLATGSGNVRRPFSFSAGFMFPLHIGANWTVAATYDPLVTTGADFGGVKLFL